MTDIDHFKSVNDTHGHGVGDDVIKYLADVLAEHTRPNDLVGRFGGEEFCIVCPDTDIAEGHVIAENIRDIIEKGIGANFLDKCQITASFGVASIHSNAANPSDMVEQADRALYVSKESGRKRVTNFTDDIDEEGSTTPAPEASAAPAPAQAPTATPAPAKPETPAVPILALRSSLPTPDKEEQTEKKSASVQKTINPVVPLFATAETDTSVKDTDTKDTEIESAGDSLRLDRSLLLDRLDQSLATADKQNHRVGVFLISIEALHKINDTFGFAVSDKLYKKIVRRLKNTLRQDNLSTVIGTNDQNISISRYGDTEICLALHLSLIHI